jgi:hypothetical protein
MALTRKHATTIALEPRMNTLLTRAARAQGVSRPNSSGDNWIWCWSSIGPTHGHGQRASSAGGFPIGAMSPSCSAKRGDERRRDHL